MYQHEIAITSEKNNETFPLMAITNLDQVKTLHLHKGELNIKESIDVIPKNWIPQ